MELDSSNVNVTTIKKISAGYDDCPVFPSMAIIGSKWKPTLIWALRDRKARFGQIAASVSTISRKMLTTTLREMEADGLVLREEFKELPPKVIYSLTERGKELIPIMMKLVEWDYKHFSGIPLCHHEHTENNDQALSSKLSAQSY